MKDMLGRAQALSPGEALKLLLAALPEAAPRVEEVQLLEAYGRILAHDVYSPEDMPSFSRSTMDGFAVRAEDAFGASETLPAYLKVIGEIKMAEAPSFSLRRGEAARISTGGMLPEGANAVVMLEHTNDIDPANIEILKPIAPDENVIKKGEDARKGELLLEKGRLLRPQDVAALAGVGISSVHVYQKLKVSIIGTGDEIISPSEELRPGTVRDINSYNLFGLLSGEGALPFREGIFRDDFTLLKGALEKALGRSDMVLITGGSSVGVRDYTANLISEKGRVLFHGVALKPGKPTIGGIIENKPVFGLPGHPAAVLICFEIFIKPVLRRLSGIKEKEALRKAGVIRAKLSKDVSSAVGRTQYISVSLSSSEDGLLAEPVPGPSGLIKTFIRGDGMIMVPSGRAGLNKGEWVDVELF